MKAFFRPREVDALQMSNGNWLVEDGHDRRVYLPDDFKKAFTFCSVSEVSSRMCEHGTKGCTIEHGSGA